MASPNASQLPPEFQYHRAIILDAAGKRAEAREILEQALAKETPFAERRDAEQMLSRL